MAKTSVEYHMEGFESDRVRCEGGGLLIKGQAGGQLMQTGLVRES